MRSPAPVNTGDNTKNCRENRHFPVDFPVEFVDKSIGVINRGGSLVRTKGLQVLAACLLLASVANPEAAAAAVAVGSAVTAEKPVRTTGAAPVHPAGRQVVALFVEGLSFRELDRLRGYPHVDTWLEQAEAGALSIRTPGARTAANGYLLLGSGGPAVYTERSGTAYHPEEPLSSGETAGERARQLSPPDGADVARFRVVFPGIYRLHAENRDKPYTARIGLLGETLARRGIPAASYGSGDYDDMRQRHAVLFAMDERGRVPRGDLSAAVSEQKDGYPYGVRTRYDYLAARIHADRTSGLIAVQLSDLARLYQMADDMDPDRFARQYEQVLADLGAFLDRVLRERRPEQLVMLLSPAPHVQAQKEKALLTPILLWRGGAAGVLTSATTRQAGVVSGLDVLPTVLSWLRVPPPEGLSGHLLRLSAEKRFSDLLREVDRIHHIYVNRSSVLYTYVMLQIVILGAASLLWLWGRRTGGERLNLARRIVRLALLSMLWFPLLFLAEGLVGWKVPPAVVLGAVITAAMAGGMLLEQGRSLPAGLAIVAGVTALALLADGMFGNPAMRRSYLGYDPVIGARFYGLGNEYEGVLIGSAILFAAALCQWRRDRREAAEGGADPLSVTVGSGLFGLVLYYMASPGLGADAGGFLAGLVGFSVAFVRMQGWRFGKKGLLLLAGGVLAGAVVLAGASLLSVQPPTHIGRAAQQIVSGDWTEVARIVQRKLEMNLRLIRVSVWSKVFAVSLVVLGLLALCNDRYLRHLARDYPYLVKGFSGVIAGSLAGLLLNDSGIITAATCIVFLVVPALYAALGESEEQRCSTS
jgi:hypothetical protein